MKKVREIEITRNDIVVGCHRAIEKHLGKTDVKEFLDDYVERVDTLYADYKNGTWEKRLNYRKLTRTNTDGKVRMIDSPSLEARIYQHAFLSIIERVYEKKDVGIAYNCKKGYGITANDKSKSLISRMKHCFYDLRALEYNLVIDQRKCYQHVTTKTFRKALKNLVSDKSFIDFGVKVCMLDGKLPIGTPTSPFAHHLVMLTFDIFIKQVAPFAARYADDVFLAFHTKEEAQAAYWRVKNFWWYMYGMRAKRNSGIIRSMDEPLDFCGYVFHRGLTTGHNKGHTTIRSRTAMRAKRSRNNKSWGSYYGLMKHADCYRLMIKIEKNMKLNQLTEKIRINRELDAPHVDIRDLVNMPITVYNFEIRKNKGISNWIKCLVGYDEIVDGAKTGRVLAREFHGDYQGIIRWVEEVLKMYDKDSVLPIEEVEITNQCGYIFKGSSNQQEYIV